ncbi:MAG: hypothetical protein AAGH99_07380 [Planctomycetota bacterium]
MKNLIAWIKTNPISVIALACIIASVGVIGYFLFVANPELQAKAEKPVNQKLNEIRRLMQQPVEVPPANADDPPEIHNVTITDNVVEDLGKIYEDLNRESEDIFAAALQINQANRQPMMEGLFPETPAGLGFSAQTRYGQLLQAMVGTEANAREVAEKTGIFVPYLNAQPPLAREEVDRLLVQQLDDLNRGDPRSGEVSQARLEQQKLEQQRELMNVLLRHAKTINIYANPELGEMLQANPEFPLQIASLGASSTSPTPSQLWEAQLELWILKDIVQAIALANDVANLRDHFNAEGEQVTSNVLNAPVKRLLRAEVLQGYVGLHGLGGVQSIGSQRSPQRSTRRGGGGGARSVVSGEPGGANYPPPIGGMTNQPRETKLSENFTFGPTGRASNSLYDVRHARVVAHVDITRLPEFLNAIGQVNLMTVLNMSVNSVDEYELLRDLYMYGQGDVVEVEMIIETLWLREWTTALMPDDAKVYVGLKEPPAGSAQPGFNTPGNFGGFPGGGFDGGFGGGFGGGYGGGFGDPGYQYGQ